MGLGSPFFGWISDLAGYRWMYRIAGLCLLVSTAVFMLKAPATEGRKFATFRRLNARPEERRCVMCQDDKNVYDLAAGRRTIRRFKPEPVARELLERLVNAARLAPSAANVQPLEFIIVDDAGAKAEVFPA